MSTTRKYAPARRTIVSFLVGALLTAASAFTGYKLDLFQKPTTDAVNAAIDEAEKPRK